MKIGIDPITVVGMLQVGEIKQGNHRMKSIWVACEQCGKERWVQLVKGKAGNRLCLHCSGTSRRGEYSPSWKGGRIYRHDGYIQVRIWPDNFFYPMTDKAGYVFEHRLVVAKALGRCLQLWEIVHHKGDKFPKGSKENRSDNRYPENLQLLPASKYHVVDSIVKTQIKNLQKRVTLLEAENTLLRIGVK
jgi:hypothetical protein